MDILNIIIGLFFIGLGFLVRSTPNLVSGYNTMPEEKKKNVDIAGLTSFMNKGMITTGVVIIAGYFLLKLLGWMVAASLVAVVVALGGTAILVLGAQKFDHNNRSRWKIIGIVAILVIVIAGVAGPLTYGIRPATMIAMNDTIEFKGMYGVAIPVSEIDMVELIDQRPEIKERTNGLSLGTIHKGMYVVDGVGKCRLLVQSESDPYILIKQRNGDKVLFNDESPDATTNLYETIRAMIEREQ